MLTIWKPPAACGLVGAGRLDHDGRRVAQWWWQVTSWEGFPEAPRTKRHFIKLHQVVQCCIMFWSCCICIMFDHVVSVSCLIMLYHVWSCLIHVPGEVSPLRYRIPTSFLGPYSVRHLTDLEQQILGTAIVRFIARRWQRFPKKGYP